MATAPEGLPADDEQQRRHEYAVTYRAQRRAALNHPLMATLRERLRLLDRNRPSDR